MDRSTSGTRKYSISVAISSGLGESFQDNRHAQDVCNRNIVTSIESHDFADSSWTQLLFRNYCAFLWLYSNMRLHMKVCYHSGLRPTRTIRQVSNFLSKSYCHTNVYLDLSHVRIMGSTTLSSLYYLQHVVCPIPCSTIETTWQKTHARTHTAKRGNGTV
jgi:hypothetical protein